LLSYGTIISRFTLQSFNYLDYKPAVLTQLIQLVSTVITWMPGVVGGGAAERIPSTILGMPYRVTEKVPTLGTQGDIGLYDFHTT